MGEVGTGLGPMSADRDAQREGEREKYFTMQENPSWDYSCQARHAEAGEPAKESTGQAGVSESSTVCHSSGDHHLPPQMQGMCSADEGSKEAPFPSSSVLCFYSGLWGLGWFQSLLYRSLLSQHKLRHPGDCGIRRLFWVCPDSRPFILMAKLVHEYFAL